MNLIFQPFIWTEIVGNRLGKIIDQQEEYNANIFGDIEKTDKHPVIPQNQPDGKENRNSHSSKI